MRSPFENYIGAVAPGLVIGAKKLTKATTTSIKSTGGKIDASGLGLSAGGVKFPTKAPLNLLPAYTQPSSAASVDDLLAMEEKSLGLAQESAARAEALAPPASTFWDQHKNKVIIGGALMVALGIVYVWK